MGRVWVDTISFMKGRNMKILMALLMMNLLTLNTYAAICGVELIEADGKINSSSYSTTSMGMKSVEDCLSSHRQWLKAAQETNDATMLKAVKVETNYLDGKIMAKFVSEIKH
jgi:hypothetical protein